MSGRLRIAAAVMAAAVLAPSFAMAVPTMPANEPSSGELVSQMRVTGDVTKGLYWDGRIITFHGEAVGERMVRGGSAWIHLNDDAYMERNVEEGAALGGYNSGMPVWIEAAKTDPIDTYGDYKHEGSIVEVTGEFRAACKDHGGDMDIHASSLEVLRPGHPALDPIRPWKVWLAIGLVLAAVALHLLDLRRRSYVAEGKRLA